jgi:type IV pilus assembly protein PilO
MPDLRQTRNRLTIIAAVLVVLNLVCLAMLVTPIAGAESSRRDQMNQLWATLKACERSPSRGVDKKIPLARKEIADFYHDRLPEAYSAISTDLDKIGAESGVKVTGERYAEKDAEIEGLQRVEISADISGDYVPVVKFINGLERSKLFFMVDGLQLGSEQSGTIKLQITLETYLRTT